MELRYGATVLTQHITEYTPEQDAVIVENRLLDGTLHMQSIGDAITLAYIEAICTEAQVDLINGYRATVTPVTLDKDGTEYTVRIRTRPQWEVLRPGPLASRLYTGTFTVHIEGAV